MDILYIIWGWPATNAGNFHWVHVCHPLFKDYPWAINGRCMKGTFGDKRGVVSCDTEDICDSGDVGWQRWCHCSNGDVIHVDVNGHATGLVFENGSAVDGIHHGLEHGWQVCEAKGHSCWFIEAALHFKCSFVFIPYLDVEVIISSSDVQFCVYGGTPQVSDKCSNERDWVL